MKMFTKYYINHVLFSPVKNTIFVSDAHQYNPRAKSFFGVTATDKKVLPSS